MHNHAYVCYYCLVELCVRMSACDCSRTLTHLRVSVFGGLHMLIFSRDGYQGSSYGVFCLCVHSAALIYPVYYLFAALLA